MENYQSLKTQLAWTSYGLPGESSPPFTSPKAAFLKRAAFLKTNLWVTKYHPNERYPAGDYPNQNPGGDGLPLYSAANRELENTELVLWYTFGHNHIPRPEDWPVMPTSCIEFSLKPNGFFDANPAMDMPPSAAKKTCCD